MELSDFVSLGLTTTILLTILAWSRTFRALWRHWGRSPFYGPIVLCRRRLSFGLEIAGVGLLVWKLVLPGPTQEDMNDKIAGALLANVHTTSMLYQALRKEKIPTSVPSWITSDPDFLPPTLATKIPELMFDEMHSYVRRSSILLADYLGERLPNCKFRGAEVRFLDFSPDTEIVSFEIARLTSGKGANATCDPLEVRAGLSQAYSEKLKLEKYSVELAGLLFLALAAFLRYLELLENERRLKSPNAKTDWYWDDRNAV